MEHQKPIHLTLDFLNGIGVAANNDYAFINREMVIVSSMCGMNNRLFKTGQPYRAKEVRIFHVKQGKARTSVNLIEHTLGEHAFGIIPPDSLLEFLEFDDEFDFQVLAVDSNFIPTPQHVVLTDQYTGQAFCMSDNLEEWQRTGAYFSLIWDAVHLHPYRREAVRHLVTSLFYHFHYLQADNPPSFTSRRTVPPIHHAGQRALQNAAYHYLLRRPPLPVAPLPEFRHPQR